MRVRVWLQILHPMSAENAEADVANRNMMWCTDSDVSIQAAD